MDLWYFGAAGVLSLCLVYPAYFACIHQTQIRLILRGKAVIKFVEVIRATLDLWLNLPSSHWLATAFAGGTRVPMVETIAKMNELAKEILTAAATQLPLPPPSLSIEDEDKDPTDAALTNTSNFCFLNATLHCLFRTPRFLNLLHRAMSAQERNLLGDAKETCCWYLMQTGFTMKEEKGACVDVVQLGLATAMKACSTLINMPDQDQQDAEECLSFFLDILNEATKVSPSKSLMTQDFHAVKSYLMHEIQAKSSLHPESYSDLVHRLASVAWDEYVLRNHSFITECFVGQIIRGSSCQFCKRLSCHLQEMSVLSLGLHTASSAMSLESCLDHFKEIEVMEQDNKMWCSQCQDKTNHCIQTLLLRTPQCLVIQLKRFTYTSAVSGKNSAPVYFPVHRLNLSPYLFLRDSHLYYQLYAVCAHLGSTLGAGHYVAYCRLSSTNTTSQWLQYDDEIIKIVDEQTMLNETLHSAYLLFYERMS
ncbi:hypothetical protein AC1031_019890 [Aphanomyces cochlioides]|nr:hypothetical protein AC1031_019890 [Aphanomyces cochlioides]